MEDFLLMTTSSPGWVGGPGAPVLCWDLKMGKGKGRSPNTDVDIGKSKFKLQQTIAQKQGTVALDPNSRAGSAEEVRWAWTWETWSGSWGEAGGEALHGCLHLSPWTKRELLKVLSQDDRVKNLQSTVRSFLNTFIELECLLTVVWNEWDYYLGLRILKVMQRFSSSQYLSHNLKVTHSRPTSEN